MSSPFKNWPLPEDEALRSSLAEFYQTLHRDADEGALAVRGVDNRQTGAGLVVKALHRMAEHYSGLKALVSGIKMPDDPGQLAMCLVLLPAEIGELADLHDLVATNAEADGDFALAQRRRERAEDLRSYLQVAP